MTDEQKRAVPMKVLYLDIETSPIEAYTWGIWQANIGINQIIKPTEVISFAAKWRGKKNKMYFDIHDSDGHTGMVDAAHGLLDEADVLVTWNGKTFDEPHLKREFVTAGMKPPSPWKHLDLMQVVKRQFKFPSNKLQYVSTALGFEGKVQHTGFDLWVRFMAGDPKARALFKKYNIQDVVLLEDIHDRILPHIPNHPHYGLYSDGSRPVCQNCESTHLQRRGWATTSVGKYPRFQCQDCGKWHKGKKAEGFVEMRGIQ